MNFTSLWTITAGIGGSKVRLLGLVRQFISLKSKKGWGGSGNTGRKCSSGRIEVITYNEKLKI